MKSIAFIVPYFGSFNNFFPYWLLSCKKNESVDWFVITDNKMEYDVPSNVHVISMTFKECKDKIQQCFDFSISLEKPYKLCDYRPAFGYIFNDLVKDFDFWGYCDVDLIWGDIRSFFTEDLLNVIDKFSNYGHCSIYKNSKKMNELFKHEYNGIPSYKEIFASPLAYIFDEKIIKFLCRKEQVRVAEKNNFFFDCSCAFYQMLPVSYQRDFFKSDDGFILKWNEGYLQLIGTKNNKPVEYPIMYGHFQKRKIKIESGNQHLFYLCDSTFCDIQNPISADLIAKKSPTKFFYWPRIVMLARHYYNKLLNNGSIRFYSYSKEQMVRIEK